MKRLFTFHRIVTLSLAVAVMILLLANYEARQEIKKLTIKVESNSKAELRLLDSK